MSNDQGWVVTAIDNLTNLACRIDDCIPRETSICPACGTGYVGSEYRDHSARCPVCRGQGARAKEADQYLEKLSKQPMTAEQAQKWVEVLGPCFWRNEFHAAAQKALAQRLPDKPEIKTIELPSVEIKRLT